jgi:peroxiredoxin
MPRILLSALIWLPVALAPVAASQALATKGPVRAKPGAAAPDFSVKTLDGKDRPMDVLRGEKSPKILVVVFWSHACPWSRAWDTEIGKIAKDFETKNVKVIAINSNDSKNKDSDGNADTPKDIERYRKDKSLSFDVYLDSDHRAADAFGAQTTPDVFVIGIDSKIAYTGRINDMQNFAKPADFKKNYLRAALEALTSGKPVPDPVTPPGGCGIKRIKK